MNEINKELKDSVIIVAKNRLSNCRENYQDLQSEINNCLNRVKSNLSPFPLYTLSIMSNLNEMVGEHAALSEKIKGLEREVELLELLR